MLGAKFVVSYMVAEPSRVLLLALIVGALSAVLSVFLVSILEPLSMSELQILDEKRNRSHHKQEKVDKDRNCR